MLVNPSPQLVLHSSHPYFNDQIYRTEYSNGKSAGDFENPVNSQLFVDLSFLCINDDNPNAQKSTLRATMFLTLFSEVDSTDIPLFLGILALSTSDSHTARHWLKIAASKGNIHAMVLLGRLYRGSFNANPFPEKDPQLITAIRWLNRAERCGSIEALYYLGELYFTQKDFLTALNYFNKYFAKTKSPIAAKFIADCLFSLEERELAMKWHLYSAAHGIQSSVNTILFDKRDRNDMTAFFQWLSLATKYNFLKDQPYFFSNLLRASLSSEIQFPPLTIATGLLSLSGIISKTYFEAAPKPTEFRAILSEAEIPGKDSLVGLPPPPPVPMEVPAYSPSALLSKALSLASPDFQRRNISLCGSVLQQLMCKKPRGVCESHVFRARSSSPNGADLFSCGVVSFLLGDTKYALSLLKRSGAAGCEGGWLMAGLILFHGLGCERSEDGLALLARCPSEPAALLHLAAAFGDAAWEARAAQHLTFCRGPHEMFEWMGDCFVDGVKYPKEPRVAMMWYSLAVSKYEEAGVDHAPVVRKMGALYARNRSGLRC